MSDHPETEHASKKKKAAASSAVAVITAASIMVSGAIDSPATLLTDDDSHRKATHTFMMDAGSIDNGLEEYSEDDEDEDEDEDEGEETSLEQGLTFRTRLKNIIMAMPMAVRLVVILPLWLIGSGLTFLTSSLWSAAAPFVSRLLSFLMILLIIFGSFVVSAKILHPELPLRKFFNKKTVPVLLIGGIVLCTAELALTLLDVHFPIKDVAVCLGHLAVLTTALIFLTKHLQKTKQGRYAPKPILPPKEETVKQKKPAVVFTDSTGTMQRIRFKEEE